MWRKCEPGVGSGEETRANWVGAGGVGAHWQLLSLNT